MSDFSNFDLEASLLQDTDLANTEMKPTFDAYFWGKVFQGTNYTEEEREAIREAIVKDKAKINHRTCCSKKYADLAKVRWYKLKPATDLTDDEAKGVFEDMQADAYQADHQYDVND